jgi:DNA-binding CsgD family transcriptional regulator
MPREILSEYVQCAREGHLRSSSQLESMTARETQTLELVKRRFSNKEIADILHVQESTVKFHLSNIYSKLQVSGRRDLIQDGPDRSGFVQLLPVLSPATSKA